MDPRPPPPPPGYYHQQPPPTGWAYWPLPEREPAKGLQLAAVICGIVGSVIGLVPIMGLFAVALGLVAIVLGFIAWGQRGRARVKRTMAAWGIGLGTLALALGIIGAVIVSQALDELDRDLNEIESDLDP